MDDALSAANKKARDEKKQSLLRAMLAGHVEQLRQLESEPAPAVAERVHAALDRVLERDRAKDGTSPAIRCGKGCDHCCKVAVEIFPHEAALLVTAAREAGIGLDIARLRRQAGYGIDDWRAQSPADRRCVFLGEDGACKVYASRPNACRKLSVVTEPALCDAEKHSPESVGRWISWEAEVLAAAALDTFEAKLMPAALLSALGEGNCPSHHVLPASVRANLSGDSAS